MCLSGPIVALHNCPTRILSNFLDILLTSQQDVFYFKEDMTCKDLADVVICSTCNEE